MSNQESAVRIHARDKDKDKDKDNDTPATSSHSQDRPLAATNAWKPSFDRRQSWSKEDQKHTLQMSAVEGVKTGPGFTEKTS
ncbi:hypothetical protein QQS21_000286 [Conoideocrella luteorostrata]|uniref:Uncharacterized protein n=1 Tax=Conoideocrella luteorostrata TaxID=1105319 RepID=A0AAJ0CZN8_9HYPO|nr:hypothetical protein QQS21_000286 [Conoideocrella luteorostrata]